MGSIFQPAPVSRSVYDHSMAGIERECRAPLSVMTFYDQAAVRTDPPKEDPIDEINQRFFCGAIVRLIGRYEMRIEKFLRSRPPEAAEAVFSFRLQAKDAPDIIRLRATDHLRSPEKNKVSALYLVWEREAFPCERDYSGQAIAELFRDLSAVAEAAERVDLSGGEVTQNILLAIIAHIDRFGPRLR
jgi:hypothetical protein